MSQTLEYFLNKFKPEVSPKGGTEVHKINRTIMAQTLGELRFKEGAEIGVAEGYHAKVMLDNIPELRLHCIDVWEIYPGYHEYPHIDKVYEEAKERLKDYNCNIIKKFSMDAAKDFEDESLDFVYIDAGHDFKNVADDICEWTKKVRMGGIVFGHDFKRTQKKDGFRIDVKDVVPAYMYAHGVKPWFVLKNDIYDHPGGWDNPGWMFVRMEGQLV